MQIKGLTYIIKLLQIPVAFIANSLFNLNDISKKANIKYYRASAKPFLFGFGSRITKTLSPVATSLRKNAVFNAGRILEFKTDSKEFDIELLYGKLAILQNMSLLSSAGVDVIIADEYSTRNETLFPTSYLDFIVSKSYRLENGIKSIKIYLPSYASVKEIKLGIDKNSQLWKEENAVKPIVFYGSSITQGCCASCPSKAYTHLVADCFGKPLLNFGFSESAKGEANVIKYIANQDACLFVLEYDHNADVDLLSKTHYNVYKIIRAEKPDVPIIFLSRFSGGLSVTETEEKQRISIIEDTIKKARYSGDKHIYFVNGHDVIKNKKICFVDDRHPNDKGMKLIADSIIMCVNENKLLEKNF